MKIVIVPSAHDGLSLRTCRFFEEAAKLGQVQAHILPDELLPQPPKFNQKERVFLTQSLDFVHSVVLEKAYPKIERFDVILPENDPLIAQYPHAIIVPEAKLSTVPPAVPYKPSHNPRVIVTGCFDYIHGGHLKFFEEAASHGELHVVVGSDANVSLLKGPDHPMFNEQIRRYQVGCIKTVQSAHISTGSGWLDAEPEINKIKPYCYIVNEDGDRPEKAKFCQENNINYLVLKRTPKEGLPPRSSTELRGY